MVSNNLENSDLETRRSPAPAPNVGPPLGTNSSPLRYFHVSTRLSTHLDEECYLLDLNDTFGRGGLDLFHPLHNPMRKIKKRLGMSG